jgi:hypothetical protein
MRPAEPEITDVSLFAECPELATAAVLQSALAATVAVFLAAYPNLSDQCRDWFSDRSAEDAYADALIQQAKALVPLLEAYRTAIVRKMRHRLAALDARNCPF